MPLDGICLAFFFFSGNFFFFLTSTWQTATSGLCSCKPVVTLAVATTFCVKASCLHLCRCKIKICCCKNRQAVLSLQTRFCRYKSDIGLFGFFSASKVKNCRCKRRVWSFESVFTTTRTHIALTKMCSSNS